MRQSLCTAFLDRFAFICKLEILPKTWQFRNFHENHLWNIGPFDRSIKARVTPERLVHSSPLAKHGSRDVFRDGFLWTGNLIIQLFVFVRKR